MTRILITGGTGMLGRELRTRLLRTGYTVRVMSRREPKPGEDAQVEWAQASLENGSGLAEALTGVNVVLHTASNSAKRQVDVEGTGRLLDQARPASIDHFIYISIVGIDQIGFSYYQNKLAAERMIEASGLPWSNLRTTQFHGFIDRILQMLIRLPLVAVIPTNWQFQSISVSEVADRLAATVEEGPTGRLPDMGGPELLTFGEMARAWLAAREMRRAIVHLPVPGKLSAGFRQGLNTTRQNRSGKITWAEWLHTHYGNSAQQQVVRAY